MTVTALRVAVDADHQVSALLLAPPAAVACYVMAHGAGAGMTHPFMAAAAEALARRGVATLRFQFPGMELGARRPDRPALAQATVRAAVAAAQAALPGLPLFAGGKSFGGRMTSQAQAEAPLAGARGLVFLGFPLHPAGRPGVARAAHLDAVRLPLLFVHGTRDALADDALLVGVVRRLGAQATLLQVADADHAFHVPARSGRRDADVLAAFCNDVADWIRGILAPHPG
jgi:predicted alpha/beta-hydrolase family hydrolase